ncbi:hypothetical protein NKI12_08070 [Mesorhizobium australicum]|uniref:Uncharacterized protein n=1 Tax=Mesorhizobium australicum TaxID=536018 RepID=A0ACC6STX4_9HYPH
MEFASCYDQSAMVLTSQLFLSVTLVFIIMAAFAARRLLSMSGRTVEQLQTAVAG